MNSKNFWLRIAGTIFGVVGAMHLLRIATSISITLGEFFLPIWINWIGLFATSFLCIGLWRISFRGK